MISDKDFGVTDITKKTKQIVEGIKQPVKRRKREEKPERTKLKEQMATMDKGGRGFQEK